MITLNYQDKSYRILDDYTLNFSSREVKFSNITIDSTNMTIEDLPVKYQKIEIKDNDKILFTGFLDTYTLPSMKNQNEFREMELMLLSPMQMATNRTCTIIGTYILEDLIPRIFEPLINDGFELVEENYTKSSQYTATFGFETIENAMNYVSNAKNLWWYIDENCGIHVRNIDYITKQLPKKEITHANKEKGLYELIPTVESLDYANKINMKNARIYQDVFGNLIEQDKIIYPNTTYDFLYPIDLSVENAQRVALGKGKSSISCFAINPYNISSGVAYNISYHVSDTGEVTTYGWNDVSFSDEEEEKTFVLQRDNFFRNLITGIRYTGNVNLTMNNATSETALKYSTVEFFHNGEINKNKNKISDSGIIEKTVNVDGKWFTPDEAIEYAKGLVNINGKQTNILTLSYDIDQKLDVGDLISVNLPNYLSIGNFVITDKSISFFNKVVKYTYKMRNANFSENYIDLFRNKLNEAQEETYQDVFYAEYSDEQINLKSEVSNL